MKNKVDLFDLKNSASRAPDICLFTATLKGGGAERIIINLAEFFTERGFIVDIVVGKFVGELTDKTPDKVRVVNLGANRIVFSLFLYMKYLKDARPRVVVSSVANPTIISCFGKIFSSVSHKLFVRVENSLYRRGRLHIRIGSIIRLAFITLTYPVADGIISISSGITRQLRDIKTLKKIPVYDIPNPAISSGFDRLMDEVPVYSEEVRKDIPTIVAVGRLAEQKGYDVLLKSFEKIYKEIPCQLLILGDGPLRDELQELARSLNITSHVHFPGFVTNPLSYVNHANVYVMSSLWEGLPGALIEALATGTPIVSTDCETGPIDVLAHGRYGILVKPGSVDDLADGLRRALKEPRRDRTPDLTEHLQQFTVEVSGLRHLEVCGLV